MIDDVRGIIERGIHSLHDVLPEIRNLVSHPVKFKIPLLTCRKKFMIIVIPVFWKIELISRYIRELLRYKALK